MRAARLLLIAFTFGLALTVCAQTWPSKRITFVVPASPGGTTDIIARLVSEPLGKLLGQAIVVDNRPGASGNIGAEVALQAPADGHTVLIQYSGYHVGNPNLFPDLRWSPTKDFRGVAMLIRAPHVIAVRGNLPARDLKQLIEYGRAHAGGLFYASSGQGTIQHVAGELFARAARMKLTHVPYKGAAPAIADMINGQVDLFITTPPSLMGHLASGKVRLLAYTAAKRHPALANLPTTAQAGMPGYEIESWFAAFMAAATPKTIVDRLSAALRQVVEDPTFRRRVEEQGAFASYMDAAALDAFVRKELAAWAQIIRSANIKPE